MLLLDIGDAPEVRAAIGVSVTSGEVSDELVMRDIYAGVASDRVLEWRDALNVDTPDAAPLLRRAAVYLTAALIAPTVPHLLSERTPDYQYQSQALPDPTARVDQLQQAAYTAVLAACGVVGVPSLTVFDTAPGLRAWVRPGVHETDLPGQLFFG